MIEMVFRVKIKFETKRAAVLDRIIFSCSRFYVRHLLSKEFLEIPSPRE